MPSKALSAVMSELKNVGEVNILLVEMTTTDAVDDDEPNMTAYPDLTINTVLYYNNGYNDWMEDLSSKSGGKFAHARDQHAQFSLP